MKNNSKTIIGIIIGALIFSGIFWIAQPAPYGTEGSRSGPSPSKTRQANSNSGTPGMLTAEESAFDFDSISMAAGKVSHQFKITNASSGPVKIEKMYTSCMCTSAKLIMGGNSFGPYGMPGHGFIPGINKILEPNEEAVVEVVFDPAAHGPAGVGRIERVVYLENSGGQPLELKISAMVTP